MTVPADDPIPHLLGALIEYHNRIGGADNILLVGRLKAALEATGTDPFTAAKPRQELAKAREAADRANQGVASLLSAHDLLIDQLETCRDSLALANARIGMLSDLARTPRWQRARRRELRHQLEQAAMLVDPITWATIWETASR